MVDHIAQTHHMYNIDGIDNHYCLCNCLFCDQVVYESYHHVHSHLCLEIVVVIIVIATTRRIKLPAIALKLASIFILLSPSPLLGPSVWPPTVILVPIGSTTPIITSIILLW